MEYGSENDKKISEIINKLKCNAFVFNAMCF